MTTIEDGNALIAKFMGFKRKQGALEHYAVPEGEHLKYRAYTLDLDKMSYHTSWDWLMPVVEKIHSLSSTGISISYKIQEQWNVVVSFIQWYNNQPKTKS